VSRAGAAPVMRRWSLATAVAVAALALSAAGAVGTPASAHDQLLASNPAEGAVLTAAPSEIRLDFSDKVLDLGGVVIVADRDGADWADGPVSISLNSVTQKLRAGAPDGAYQIRWRVVSADGHPISDVVNYSVGDRAAEQITTNQGSGATSTSTPATAPSRTDVGGGGLPSLVVYGGLGLAGAIVGVAVYLLITFLIRRRATAK
jgi:copper resistance protein C